MGKSYSTATDIGGAGNAVDKAGTYHCCITRSAEGESTRGNPMTGMSSVLTVLAGTNADQKDREFHLHLFEPDLTKSEENQKWALAKITAYGVATNQFEPAKLGEAQSAEFGQVDGQQLIITLEENEYNGKTSLQVAYANIYHVDDPRAAKFPRDEEALALLPKENRRDSAWFDAIVNKKNGKGSPAKAAQESRLSEAELANL